MSQDISVPSARVPMVDERGLITREWLSWILGMFARVGGPTGFSNSELYGDAVALQSYDELLERISALEAQNRDLLKGMQMLALSQFDGGFATPPQAITPDTFARLKVLGETDLAISSGRVRIGVGIGGSSAKLQVAGDVETTGDVKSGANLSAVGTTTAASYRVGANQVVAARVAGVPAYTAYAGQTAGAAYSQTQAQNTDNAIKAASAQLALVNAALRTHGLVGD